MIRFSRASLAVIALSLFGASVASAAPPVVSAPTDPSGRLNTIVEDGHPLCALQLTVTATESGTPSDGPFTYQWRRNGVNVVHATANQPTLRIQPSSLADAGNYTCVVTNADGSTTSSVAKVAVVNIQPGTVVALSGQTTATLRATAAAAAGTTLSYRWFWKKNGDNLSLPTTSPKYAGANTHTLTIRNVAPGDAEGQYFCRVTAVFGTPPNYAMESGYRNLVVVPTPASKIVSNGEELKLEVFPVSSPGATALTYQWKKAGVDIAGATSAALVIPSASASDSNDYTVTVGTEGATPVTTAAATAFVVDNSSANFMAAVGASPILTFSPIPSGAAYSFQWHRGTPGSSVPLANDLDYANVTTASLTVKGADAADATSFFCRISAFGSSRDTGLRNLILIPSPGSVNVEAGGTATLEMVPLNADVATVNAMTFQWKKGGLDMAGQTNRTLTINNVSTGDAGDYYCVVTLAGVGTVISPVGKIAIVDNTPSTTIVLAGASPILSISSPAAAGQTFQWFRVGSNTPLAEDAKYAGVTTRNLTVKNATPADALAYFCRITTFGQSADSGLRNLVVVPTPAGRTVAVGSMLDVVVTPAAPDGIPQLTFQWRKNTVNIAGANQAAVVISNNAQLSDSGDYTCVVTVTGGGTVTTPPARVVVVDNAPAALLVGAGASPTFTFNTTGLSQTFQWFKVGAGPGGSDQMLVNDAKYAGATAKTLQIKSVTEVDGGLYYCRVTANGESANSGNRRLIVAGAPTSRLVALGGATTLNSMIGGADAGTLASMTFQWKRAGVDIGGATASSYNINPVTLASASTYTYSVSAPGLGTVVSGTGRVVVVDVSASTKSAFAGGNATLSITIAGTGHTIQWFKVGDPNPLPNGAKYSGVTTSALTVINVAPTDAGDYFARVSAFGEPDVNGGLQTLGIQSAPELGTLNPPEGIIKGSYSYQIPVDPDPLKAPTSYGATPLPAGLLINTSTGVISGTPTAAGTTTVTFSATNGAGTSSKTADIVIKGFPDHLQGTFVSAVPRSAVLGAELGGIFNMNVASSGGFTGSVRLGAALRSFAGALDVQPGDPSTADGTATVTATGSGVPPLTLTFTAGPDNLINGTISNGTDAIAFSGWRNTFAAGTGASYTGRYHFAIGLPAGSPNANTDAVPQGVGYGNFTVSSNGTYSVSGKTADNENILASAFVGPSGQGMFYTTLYLTAAKGSLLGEFIIDDKANANTSDNSMQGSASWSRPPDPSSTQRAYRAGFGNSGSPVELMIDGGRYDPPVDPTLVLGVTDGTNNATLSFENGGLAAADSNPNVPVSIKTGNNITIAANPTQTKFLSTGPNIASTGYFVGSFVLKDDDPTTPTVNPDEWQRIVNFYGQIYPSNGQLIGAGYFLMDQLPTNGPPATTRTTSPRLSGAAFFEKAP